jgi:hypothetical protein
VSWCAIKLPFFVELALANMRIFFACPKLFHLLYFASVLPSLGFAEGIKKSATCGVALGCFKQEDLT